MLGDANILYCLGHAGIDIYIEDESLLPTTKYVTEATTTTTTTKTKTLRFFQFVFL